VSSSHDDTIIIWDFLNDQSKVDNCLEFESTLNANANTSNTSSSSSNNTTLQNQHNQNLWLPGGANANNPMNLNLLNNSNIRQDLSSPSTSPRNQRRDFRLLNKSQNSPPSPMEGDD